MELNDLFPDLSKPTLPAQSQPNDNNKSGVEELTRDLTELQNILQEIERLKRLAKSPDDWRVIMVFIATQKPRISEMAARAKRVHALQFGGALESQYTDREEGSKPPSAKIAEIRARTQAALAEEVRDRFDRTWKDLEALIWACKDVATAMDQEKSGVGFEPYPDHLFPDGHPSSSS